MNIPRNIKHSMSIAQITLNYHEHCHFLPAPTALPTPLVHQRMNHDFRTIASQNHSRPICDFQGSPNRVTELEPSVSKHCGILASDDISWYILVFHCKTTPYVTNDIMFSARCYELNTTCYEQSTCYELHRT